MERWGSSYGLQDVSPVRLIGGIAGSTPPDAPGTIRISFVQDAGVFSTVHEELTRRIIVKWDVALRLIALMHVLVLQNRLLRGESPDLRITRDRARLFSLTGGARSSAIECSWSATTSEVTCEPVAGGAPDQFELVLGEDAAAELVAALAERIAINGVAKALGRDE